MPQLVFFISFLLFVGSLISLITGFIKPSLFKNLTRKQISIIFSCSALAFFIFTLVTVPASEEPKQEPKVEAVVSTETAQPENQEQGVGINTLELVPIETASPTPSPTSSPTPEPTIAPTPSPTVTPTQEPRYKQSVQTTPSYTGSQYTCNCAKTCTQMSSCSEAQYQLNVCGCSRRDADNDGIACDSECQ